MAPLRLDEQNLGAYLDQLGLISHSRDPQDVEIRPAGDGNINWVRRVIDRRAGRSWVVKQARTHLEAFPEYAAPIARIGFEAGYFERVASFDHDRVCPRIDHFDADNAVLVMEDLSESKRLDQLLASLPRTQREVTEACTTIARFLARVHQGTADLDLAENFHNDAMRRLHGDHIFFLPFRDNDFPLSPSVARIAATIRADAPLVSTIDAAYRRYLESDDALVHADVQPTNILVTVDRPKLLDAEIAHVGDPAFDIGVLIAHLQLAAVAAGTDAVIAPVWNDYANTFTHKGTPSFEDVARYAGIEMLRRTLGAARAPGVERDECAARILEIAAGLVESPPGSAG